VTSASENSTRDWPHLDLPWSKKKRIEIKRRSPSTARGGCRDVLVQHVEFNLGSSEYRIESQELALD